MVLSCVVFSDQVSKAIIRAKLPANDFRFLREEDKFFCFTHQHNRGLVGGMFTGKGVITLAAPILASLVLLYLFKHLDRESRLQSVAYGLVAGGAVGNLVDRFRLGYVTDFLQFHFYFIPFDFPWKRYPAFNIADSAICVGVFFLVVTWHTVKRRNVPDSA